VGICCIFDVVKIWLNLFSIRFFVWQPSKICVINLGNLCDLFFHKSVWWKTSNHTDFASAPYFLEICVFWPFPVICVIEGSKSHKFPPQTDSCDLGAQITHVTGPLRSHGWGIDRPFFCHVSWEVTTESLMQKKNEVA
jgi:hypothetical protein